MRNFYNDRLLRERVLLLVFLGIGVLWPLREHRLRRPGSEL